MAIPSESTFFKGLLTTHVSAFAGGHAQLELAFRTAAFHKHPDHSAFVAFHPIDHRGTFRDGHSPRHILFLGMQAAFIPFRIDFIAFRKLHFIILGLGLIEMDSYTGLTVLMRVESIVGPFNLQTFLGLYEIENLELSAGVVGLHAV